MISLILKGGLGNQMFQYAYAKSIALARNEELKLFTTFLDTRLPIKDFTTREYELDLFDIPEKTTSIFESHFLEEKLGYIILKIQNKLNQSYIQEGDNPYLFDPTLQQRALSVQDPILEGYFNNYLYFEKFSSEIAQLFTTDTLYDSQFKEIEKKISSSESVSINIRRGDYLNSKHKDIFVHLDKDYYQKTVGIIRERVREPLFFIFSYDDPEWIQKELSFDKNEIVVLGKEYVGERFKTYLRLISLCKHNIISNSTFAFWGAFLNKNRSKIVISPQKWMTNYQFESPRDWSVIVNQ